MHSYYEVDQDTYSLIFLCSFFVFMFSGFIEYHFMICTFVIPIILRMNIYSTLNDDLYNIILFYSYKI